MNAALTRSPGQHAGDEQAADGSVGDHAVEDDDHAWRHDYAERAGGGCNGGRKVARVAARFHGRDHDRGDGAGVGGGRAADAAIDQAGGDIGKAQAAAHPAKHGFRNAHDAACETAAVHHAASQQEQWDRRQGDGIGAVESLLSKPG